MGCNIVATLYRLMQTSQISRYNPRDLNESKLMLGDAGGGVSCINFSQATVGLFDITIGKLVAYLNCKLNVFIEIFS